MADKKNVVVHIVSHTHWDRAWYLTFQQFRYRLVLLINKLIRILETDSEYKSFHLDGQTVVLEDFLEIKPELENKLVELISESRIVTGPWYVLHDEFLVSGESTIRNLLTGTATGNKYGKVSDVGYIPDAFGHIAQMPQILLGFNIDNCIFTRGMGDELEKLGTEFIWEAPDGSKILAVNQLNGYCNGAHLGYENDRDTNDETVKPDFDRALVKIKKEIEELSKFANTKHILINNGCDHEFPDFCLPELIDYLIEEIPDCTIIHSSFQDVISEIKKDLKNPGIFRGEFRRGKNHPLLNGVYSTRTYLKQLNHKCETGLEKFSEPLAVVANRLNVSDYPESFIESAWKLLMKNHPHDNICGCSIDQVHKEMVPVFEQVLQISDEINKECMINIGRNLKSDNFHENIALLVFNSLPFSRTEAIDRMIFLDSEMDSDFFEITDESSNSVPCHFNNIFRLKKCDTIDYILKDIGIEYRERLLEFVKNNDNLFVGKNFPGDYYVVLDLTFLAQDIPAVGYKTFFIRKTDEPQRSTGDVTVSGNTIENSLYKVSVKSNGSFDVYVKKTQTHYRNLHIFKDTEDAGDEYDYSPSTRGEALTSGGIQGEIGITENNSLKCSIESKVILDLPEGLEKNRKARKKILKDLPVSVHFSLRAESPVIEIITRIDNTVEDHRLRAHFAIPVKTNYSLSDAQFCIMERDIKIKPVKGWKQKPQGTHPQQNFCLIEDGSLGLAVVNQGIREFEVIPTGDGSEIALTLIRAVGWLSRNDLHTRPYNAGPMLPTPDAQCKGMHEFRYGVYLYEKSWQEEKVHKHALLFNCPLITHTFLPGKGKLPLHYSFMEIYPDDIILSTLKKTRERNSIICRFYNIAEKEIDTTIKFFFNFKECWMVNLREERTERVKFQGSKIQLKIPSCKIITLEIV